MTAVVVDAAAVGRSYDCKTPGCVGAAITSVGRYSYCEPCRTRRAQNGGSTTSSSPTTQGGFVDRLKSMQSLARRVDQARGKARKATESALALKRQADELEQQLRDAVRELGAPSVDGASSGGGQR